MFRKFIERDSLQRAPKTAHTTLKNHVEQACNLSWCLLTTTAPLIISCPQDINEDWQDREFEYWDKHVKNFRLYYTRPVLFGSYEGGVRVKGWVGNRDTLRRTPPIMPKSKERVKGIIVKR